MSALFSSNLVRRVLTAVVLLPLLWGVLVFFPDRAPWMLAAIFCVIVAPVAFTVMLLELMFETPGSPDRNCA